MSSPTESTIPTMTFRNQVVFPASSLSFSVSYPLSLKYLAIRSSAGFFTSRISREGSCFTPSPYWLFAHSRKLSGTRIVFSRSEKPTMRPCIRLTCPRPLRRISRGIIPIMPSEIWGMFRLWAKPKLYRFR